MERGLLSDPELRQYFDDVVWMYLFQDFSHDESDRAAERVAIRFGITVWPQHFLVDPHTLEVIGDTGRTLESFGAAVRAARVAEGPGMTAAGLAASDRRAAELEELGEGEEAIAAAERALADPDVVVRFRAVQRLGQAKPAAIVARAVELLAEPHDQTRFLVCQAVAAAGDARAKGRLEELVERPEGSRNPNVLRIRAVEALGRCGDAASVAVIAPFASSGEYFNGLTGVAVDALVAIAGREPAAPAQVAAVLARGFPRPPGAGDERGARACVALARRVHEALRAVTGRDVAFPTPYDEPARATLAERWRDGG
ncbi:MAG: HEAT repeat domain-containing protein [Planctomycetes bacterium]|nr:HEAT repeat domain-containing protein [Planctomycetota bacterium]